MDDRSLVLRSSFFVCRGWFVVSRLTISVCLVILCASCNKGGKEFPLAVGRTWTYMVDSEFGTQRLEEVKVLRQVPVGDVTGYELGGEMGESRLAWKDGVLLAQQLPNATFNPPIPLVVAGADKTRRDW